MKRLNHRPLILVGALLLALGVFLLLSLSDVIRLNPDLENASMFGMAGYARNTQVDVKLDAAIAQSEVPEGAPKQTEASVEPSLPQAATLAVGDAEYYVLSYEDFAARGGRFTTDKYGAFKVLEADGGAYCYGVISYSQNLWTGMSGWGRAVCALSFLYIPMIVLGVLLLLAGLYLRVRGVSRAQGVSVGGYLGKVVTVKRVKTLISDNAIIVGIILLAVFVSIMRPNFVSEANFRNLLSNTAVRFIIALGVSGCLITKGTDLSAGRVTGLAACVSAILLQRAGDYASKFYPNLGNLPILPVLLLVLAICAAIGAVNGTVISVFKVPPFIATLGMQTLVYGICLVYTGAQPIGNLQSGYTGIALGYVSNRMFSYIAIIALAVGMYMWFLYNKTRHGKFMYAIGGNEVAAEVAGINTVSTKIRIYTLAAILYGLTGFLMAAKSGGASVNTAQGYELEAIAGCTIGGVSVNGGVGRISGILIGVLVFELLKIALQFMGVESSYTYIAQGLVIIIAVALDLRKYLAKK